MKDKNGTFVGSTEGRVKRFLLMPWRAFRSRSRRIQLLIVLIIIILLAAIAGGIWWSVRKNDNKKEQLTVEQEIADDNAAYEKRVAAQKNAPTPEQQFTTLQAAAAALPEPNNSQQSLEVNVQAAFAGAEANNPAAKQYAAKALELYPKDESIRKMNAGQISRLELIAKGDYAAALK